MTNFCPEFIWSINGRTPMRRPIRGEQRFLLQMTKSVHWSRHWEYIGRRGISLSGSYQRGYSTTYNTRSHIKVVCNGYILTHISNWNSQSVPKTIPSMGRPPSDMIRGTWPICMQVKCTRVNIVTFWHGFWLRGVQPLSGRW